MGGPPHIKYQRERSLHPDKPWLLYWTKRKKKEEKKSTYTWV